MRWRRVTGPDDPELRLRQVQAFWYQWLVSYRNWPARAGTGSREGVCLSLVWRVWSPEWQFSPDEFAAIVPSLGNEQFVETVIHYYRHRRNAAPGESTLRAAGK